MSESGRILLVDDDREIRDLVSRFLSQHGYEVLLARDGREMHSTLAARKVDLLVLDIMLPGGNGLELCRQVRQTSHLPVMMLTAMGEEADRVVGLEIGADDYLTKPFSPRELLARVRAILRRASFRADEAGSQRAGRVFRFSGWRLDLARRRLESPDGLLIGLTTGEYEMLVVFAEHANRVLSRDQLLDLTRGEEASPFDRSIDVQVSRLRRKIEPDPKTPSMIVTVPGGRYVFTPAIEAE